MGLHRGVTIESVEADGPARRVRLADGTVLDVDLVFVAIGRDAATSRALGWTKPAWRPDGFGAVTVDAENRANSVTHIYAIGDVTDRLNLTPVATAEGHALADTLFGTGPRFVGLDNVATAVFSIPPLGTVGLTEAQAATRGPANIFLTRFTPMRHNADRPGAQDDDEADRRPGRRRRCSGAHMLGEDAPEIMQGLSIAINCGATKADFDRTIGIHPTAAEEFVTLRTRPGLSARARAPPPMKCSWW